MYIYILWYSHLCLFTHLYVHSIAQRDLWNLLLIRATLDSATAAPSTTATACSSCNTTTHPVPLCNSSCDTTTPTRAAVASDSVLSHERESCGTGAEALEIAVGLDVPRMSCRVGAENMDSTKGHPMAHDTSNALKMADANEGGTIGQANGNHIEQGNASNTHAVGNTHIAGNASNTATSKTSIMQRPHDYTSAKEPHFPAKEPYNVANEPLHADNTSARPSALGARRERCGERHSESPRAIAVSQNSRYYAMLGLQLCHERCFNTPGVPCEDGGGEGGGGSRGKILERGGSLSCRGSLSSKRFLAEALALYGALD